MMGLGRQTLLLVGSVVLATDLLSAQIDVINHRQWSWLMQRRREFQLTVQELPAERRDLVARALTRCQEGVPLLTLGRAIAIARGFEPDAHFLYRAGLQVLAMPEVVSKKDFKHIAVTLYAPHIDLTGELPMPKKYRFVVRVKDGGGRGKEVWRGKIDELEEVRALREFRVTCKVPIADLPDGDYRVFIDTILDDQAPRTQDLELSAAFSVLHDFKKLGGYFRLAGASDGVVQDLPKLAPLPQAILRGASEFATRAYFGMPGVDPARAVGDLRRAEAILKNVKSDKPALEGLRGYVDIALPGDQGELVFVTPRLPSGGLPAPGSEKWQAMARRPLMLFIGRRPTWDLQARRPSHPRYALPAYLAASLDLAKFDAKGQFQVVVVESPGRIPVRHLATMLEGLSEVLPFDSKRLVLVGEGQGASSVVDLALDHPTRVAGLVVFGNSGGLATPQLRTLKAVPILAIKLQGQTIGAAGIDLLPTYAKHAPKPKGLEIVKSSTLPWSIAVPLSAARIEAFGLRATKR